MAPRVWDRGGKRPVLALHCSLAHSGAWAGLAGHLDGVTLAALDLPGHGKADVWDGRTDLHGLATREALLAAEQLGSGGPIDLIGHSFGATVALRMALERPDLVRSLVLIEPVLFAAARAAGDPAFAAVQAENEVFAKALAAGRRDEAAALFHAAWGAGGRFGELPERQQRYIIDRIHLVGAQEDVIWGDAAGLLTYMRLESLGIPVLLVEGAESPPIIAAIQGELARRLPQVTRVIVPGAGHMVPITHPAEVARAVQTFWALS